MYVELLLIGLIIMIEDFLFNLTQTKQWSMKDCFSSITRDLKYEYFFTSPDDFPRLMIAGTRPTLLLLDWEEV